MTDTAASTRAVRAGWDTRLGCCSGGVVLLWCHVTAPTASATSATEDRMVSVIEPYRRAGLLCDGEGLSYAPAAAGLGWAPGTGMGRVRPGGARLAAVARGDA